MKYENQLAKFGGGTLVDTNTAAEYLGLSNQWLRMARMSNPPWTGPAFVKISKRAVRYKVEDLDQFVAQRRVPSSLEPAEAGAA